MTRRIAILAAALCALTPAVAEASTWTVDDDRADCPNAGFTGLQAAINQAAPWDTIVICPGVYRGAINATNATNSPAQAGAKNGFTITKPLTLRGAGADKVFLEPDPAVAGASLAGTAPFLRDGGGAVLQINRQAGGSSDYTENFVDISGVTVRSPSVYAEAGVAFFNTSGRIANSVIGPLYRSADATELAAKPHGYGVLMANSLQGASEAAVRREVTVADSLITGYQSGGIFFDDARGTDGNAANTTRSGVLGYGYVTGSRIVGSGPSTVIPQTGIRYHAGERGSVLDSEISGNSYTPDPRKSVGVLLTDAQTGADPSNPAVRAFSARNDSFGGNGYGLFNANITNDAVRQGAPAQATGDWWGCAGGPAVGAASNGGCEGVSGNDTTPAASVELGTPMGSAPAPLDVPADTEDAPPTVAFSDPAPDDVFDVGDLVHPVVAASDDFGVKAVALSVDGEPVATDTHAPYVFNWTPSYADIGDDELEATVTDSSGQTTTRTLQVSVPTPDGYKPLTVDTTSWDAGTLSAGETATKIITLTNTGQTPIKLDALDVSGEGFSLPGGTCSSGVTFDVGASCTVTLAFSPSADGTVGGAFKIGYSAPGGTGPAVIQLTGTKAGASSSVSAGEGATAIPLLPGEEPPAGTTPPAVVKVLKGGKLEITMGGPGIVKVTLTASSGAARLIRIGGARVRFSEAGTKTVTPKLTARGKRLLRGGGRVTMTIKTSAGGVSTTTKKRTRMR